MPSDRVNEYLKSVCAEVRWRQAHDAVKSELSAYIWKNKLRDCCCSPLIIAFLFSKTYNEIHQYVGYLI